MRAYLLIPVCFVALLVPVGERDGHKQEKDADEEQASGPGAGCDAHRGAADHRRSRGSSRDRNRTRKRVATALNPSRHVIFFPSAYVRP